MGEFTLKAPNIPASLCTGILDRAYIGTPPCNGTGSTTISSTSTSTSTSIKIPPQYVVTAASNDIADIDDTYTPYNNMYEWVHEILEKTKEKKMDNKKNEVKQYDGMYYPKRIVFNPPATVVFWKDGTKTVVKCSDGEVFNEYAGFCAALAKKIFGYNNQIVRLVKKGERQGTPDEYAYAIGKIALTPKKEPAKKAPVKKSAPKKPTATKKTVSTKKKPENEQKGTTACKNK